MNCCGRYFSNGLIGMIAALALIIFSSLLISSEITELHGERPCILSKIIATNCHLNKYGTYYMLISVVVNQTLNAIIDCGISSDCKKCNANYYVETWYYCVLGDSTIILGPYQVCNPMDYFIQREIKE
jgi:hypothetical protein